jgi:hypothetical protein
MDLPQQDSTITSAVLKEVELIQEDPTNGQKEILVELL